MDERFDITEVVSQSAQELERMEQVLPDREVREFFTITLDEL